MNKRSTMVITCILLLLFSLGAVAQQYSYDYKNMKMEEYNAELSKWQKRLNDANTAIAEQEAQIAQLQS
ncbi:MAG: hypothetical protein KDI38_01750, partial [Calditrichaeota bacterium]|nr:hypothetical protein [Calditrichota bacterium]MCB0302486.1 hypothetical protein [Calditrichota bacterium]